MHRLLCLLIVLVTGLVYAASLSGEFLFDDFRTIVRNSSIQSLQFGPVRAAFGETRPIAAFTIAANYAIGGREPFGYHVVNTVIHMISALLVFGLSRRLLREHANRDRIAFVAAIVFAVHPLQTSAVAYITQRMESLASMFVLLTLYALTRGAHCANAKAWGLVSVASFSLALFTKEFTVMVPVLAVLFDRAFLSKCWLELWRKRKWLYASYAIPLLVFLWVLAPKLDVLQASQSSQRIAVDVDDDGDADRHLENAKKTTLDDADRSVGDQQNSGLGLGGSPSVQAWLRILEESKLQEMPPVASTQRPTWWQFFRSQPSVVLHYVGLVLIPVGQCFDYQWQPETSGLKIAVAFLLTGSAVLVSAFLLLRPSGAKGTRQLAFLFLSLFIVLSPRSTFQVVDIAVEYRMYLPMAALSSLLAITIWWLSGVVSASKQSLVFAVVSAIICLGLARQTIERNLLFTSRLEMWAEVVSKRPLNVRARINYANALAADRRHDDALEQTRFAIDLLKCPMVQQVKPAEAYRFLGDRLLGIGRYRESEKAYLVALRLDPTIESVLPGLSELAFRSGNVEVADAIIRIPAMRRGESDFE